MCEDYIIKAGLNKEIILFYFMEDRGIVSIINEIITELKKLVNIYNIYYISDYDSFVEIIYKKEAENINNENFLLYFILNDPGICSIKSIKHLVENKLNHRILSSKDLSMLKSHYFKDYLLNRGINVSDKIIKINNFIFDNPFNENLIGSFSWGDLILPTFFNDYSFAEDGPYEYKEAIIEKNDIVFDCGANIGSFSALALSKGSEVHAFEPINETFLLLNYHLRHFKKSGLLHLNNFGLSNQKGIVDFYIKNDSFENSYVNDVDCRDQLECNVTTIDEYVKEKNIQRVDFIKADIEGAERDMLIGAIETIKKYKPKISICTYHLKDDPRIIEDILKDACNEYNIVHKWRKCYAYI
jgi:FkbM family methyltransferase